MVARDDSVIRGSLIASLIFLVLSLALNFFLWNWGDAQANEAVAAKERLNATQTELKTKDDQTRLMKAMLGVGSMTEAEFDLLKQSASGDAEMTQIEQQYVKDMALFGADVDPQNRNYPKLPEFLMNAIRSVNEQYGAARNEVKQIKLQADSDVANARKAQQVAEEKASEIQKKLDNERQLFAQDRERINKEKEDTSDTLTKKVQEFNAFQQLKSKEISQLTRELTDRENTIQVQKLRLNILQSDRIESVQGRITAVRGDVVNINLGREDALRAGVTFGVIDQTETRLQDAEVMATIQVTKVFGAHLSEARIVLRPSIENPIIPGDMIYSPFWAPGRRVKIGLAGEIDIDGDKRPDNDGLKGMIRAAGADVVYEVTSTGIEQGKLDASIRFLVMDDEPDDEEIDAANVAALGKVKARARELGLTIIPSWKLQAFLRTIDDTITTPLGSAVRGEDFPPRDRGGAQDRLPTDLPEIYKNQRKGMQLDNKILPP